jgi:hypothetical protein
MTAVGLVAVDLAAARALLGPDDDYFRNLGWLVVVGPAVLASEVALLGLAFGRGRAFWGGFLTAGALAGASAVLALADPPLTTTTITVNGSTTTEYPGGPMARLWFGYADLVFGGLERLRYPYLHWTTTIPSALTVAAVAALP